MFYTQATIARLLKMSVRKLTIVVSALALVILAWSNLFFQVNINANAATIQDLHLAVTVEGISDQVEGKVEKDIGTVQRNVGKVTGQTEGALKQAKGKAKQDIGTTKNKLDKAKDQVEATSDNLIDSVKNFFE